MGNRPRISVDEKDAIYDLVNRGLTLGEIEKELAKGSERGRWPKRDRKTVERHVKACTWAIKNADKSQPDFSSMECKDCKSLGGSEGMLQDWLKFVQSGRPLLRPGDDAWWRRRHLDALGELAKEIRSMVGNYCPELLAYVGGPADDRLVIGDNDWSLQPGTWVSLVVPNLEEEALWGEHFESFGEHTRSSSMWTHYRTMVDEAHELEKKVGVVFRGVFSEMSLYRVRWERNEEGNVYGTEVCRTPITPDIPEDVQPVFCPVETDELLKYLAENGCGFSEERKSLRNLLRQLWEALKPDRIEREIAAGRCSECS